MEGGEAMSDELVPVMRHWEYHTHVQEGVLDAPPLAKLGAEGWELCGIIHRGPGPRDYIFKRELGRVFRP